MIEVNMKLRLDGADDAAMADVATALEVELAGMSISVTGNGTHYIVIDEAEVGDFYPVTEGT